MYLNLTPFCPVLVRFSPSSSRDVMSRSKGVDENQNHVSSPSQGGLAGKLQQLLTPTRNRISVRRTASVDDRRPGGSRREHRQSRKSQVTETLLRAKDRLVNANSEVRPGYTWFCPALDQRLFRELTLESVWKSQAQSLWNRFSPDSYVYAANTRTWAVRIMMSRPKMEALKAVQKKW